MLTGVSFAPGELGVMGYDARRDEFFSYFHRRLDASFHGTRRYLLLRGGGGADARISARKALALAADYTVDCIECTMNSPGHVWYGVEFERAVPNLLKRLEQ